MDEISEIIKKFPGTWVSHFSMSEKDTFEFELNLLRFMLGGGSSGVTSNPYVQPNFSWVDLVLGVLTIVS